ncbi:hypothetical protein ACA910_009566 [Epithemia clementina (nom. ined.)]
MSSTRGNNESSGSGRAVNKYRYIDLGQEETKENWDRFVNFSKPALEYNGVWFVVVREHSDLEDPDEAEIRGDKVWEKTTDSNGNEKWEKMDDDRAKIFQLNRKAINFLTQCIGDKKQLLKELKMNGGHIAAKWWAYLKDKSTTRDTANRYSKLDEEMTSLNPINFEDGHKYFAELEDLNNQLREINSDCKLTKMQLKVKAFNSMYNPRENKVTSWSQFRNNMSKGDNCHPAHTQSSMTTTRNIGPTTEILATHPKENKQKR